MTRLSNICPRLQTTDLERACTFYRDVLNFRLTTSWPAHQPSFCMLRRDAVEVAFFTAPPDAAVPPGGPRVELYIEVDDAAALHTSLRGQVTIEWGPEVYSYGRREFSFRDPDGHLIIITQPTADPPTCVV